MRGLLARLFRPGCDCLDGSYDEATIDPTTLCKAHRKADR